MISEKQEQQVQHACYSIGSQQLAPWLRKILELQNEVDGLKQLYGSLLSRITEVGETASV